MCLCNLEKGGEVRSSQLPPVFWFCMTTTHLQSPQVDRTGVLGRLQIWCMCVSVCVCAVCVLGGGVGIYILYISNNNHMIKKYSFTGMCKLRYKRKITQLFQECTTSVEDYSDSSNVRSKCLLEAGSPWCHHQTCHCRVWGSRVVKWSTFVWDTGKGWVDRQSDGLYKLETWKLSASKRHGKLSHPYLNTALSFHHQGGEGQKVLYEKKTKYITSKPFY